MCRRIEKGRGSWLPHPNDWCLELPKVFRQAVCLEEGRANGRYSNGSNLLRIVLDCARLMDEKALKRANRLAGATWTRFRTRPAGSCWVKLRMIEFHDVPTKDGLPESFATATNFVVCT